MPETVSIFISPKEFAQFDAILCRLLDGASEREQVQILHIHQRLTHMKQAQKSDQDTLDYLKGLAS